MCVLAGGAMSVSTASGSLECLVKSGVELPGLSTSMVSPAA
jgi:hypothetical protein